VFAGGRNENVAWALPGVAVRLCGASGTSAGFENVAVTEAFAVSVTAQLAVPEQPPLHPVNVEPAEGDA
jgi:hypothetical protein